MIVINKDSTNNVVVTVSQDTNTNYSYYLFVFYSLMRGATIKFTAEDTSTSPERYNLFEIVETTPANATGGEVSFTTEGDYKYEIYGKWTNDLDVPPSSSALESGYARVQGTTYVYDSTNSDYNNIGYDPDAE